ncbi:hypothetical protein LRP88_04517 [Fusarium phalaenopsidis]
MSGTSSTTPQGLSGFGNHPAVSRAWLKHMVTILETRGQLSHVAWKRALDEFRKLLLLPQDPSAFAPLHILSVAKKAYDEDFEHFGDFIHQVEANPMLLVNRQRPVSACEWWMTSGMKVWIENLDDDVYFRIHYARRRFLQAHELCYSLDDTEKGREVACKGLHHMKAFVHLHQNGRVLAQVGNHIEELQKFIRDKGLGGCLPSFY